MSFQTAKGKAASRRFMLIKVTPARYIGGDLASEGSGVYSMTFPFEHLERVERNGVALTEVATVANNDEYSFDPTTGELTVKLASAPSETTNVLVAFHSLYYTGDKARVVGKDPESPTVDPVTWEPLIESYPKIKQSVRNSLAGILSIDSTRFTIVRTTGFEDLLSADDSFYQKDVRVWICIDDVTNIQKAFIGKVSGVRITPESVNFDIYDTFAALKQSAYMGDTSDDCFPDDTNESQKNKPIPYMVGNYTRYREIYDHDLEGSGEGGKVPNPDTMLEALCTSYNATVSTSNNRTWTLCRTNSEGFSAGKTGTSITITSIDGDDTAGASSSAQVVKLGWNDNTTPHPVTGYSSNYYSFHVRVGDTVRANTSGGGTQYGIVIEVQSGAVPIGYVKVFWGSYHATVTKGDTMQFYHRTALVITNGAQSWYPCQNRDFTVSTETLTSGNKLLKVTFVNNFETHFPDIDVLTPDRFTVKFRTFHGGLADPNDGTSAAWDPQTFLKTMLTAAGITCAADSFDGGTYAVDFGPLLFSIPLFDEGDFASYRDYAELILRSVLGYVTFNADFEAIFELLGAPSPTETVDRTLRVEGSTSVDIDYEDIITDLRLENPDSNQSDIASDAKAKRLHGISRTRTERSVLAGPSDADRQLPFYAARKATYRFKTATEHLDAAIGDDLTLESDMVLGGSGSAGLKILSLDKSTDVVEVEASDLEGL